MLDLETADTRGKVTGVALTTAEESMTWRVVVLKEPAGAAGAIRIAEEGMTISKRKDAVSKPQKKDFDLIFETRSTMLDAASR